MTIEYYNFADWHSDFVSGTKILVLGCPGSGKSTFSKQLALELKQPIFYMDDEYWGRGWTRPEESEFRQRLLKILTLEQWILDGNYAGYLNERLAYADTVIMLDIPPLTCLYRVIWRSIKRQVGETSSLPREIRKNPTFQFQPNFKFLSKILLFDKNTMPEMRQKLLNFSKRGKVYWIRKK